MPKPIAVLISDIHFTVPTLELASTSLRLALKKAEELGVPLIDAGDTMDSKAIIRAECMNALISIVKHSTVKIYVLVGNHTLINEKAEENALQFLTPYCTVVSSPIKIELSDIQATLIPYMSDKYRLIGAIEATKGGELLIMHQGIEGANMGHYMDDKSALKQYRYSDHRVISGHYHKRQDIVCSEPKKNNVGVFSYIGNPYSLSFGEADDPEKGFQVLYEDGSLEFVPTNLRKHIIIDYTLGQKHPVTPAQLEDLVWVKVRGINSELKKLPKSAFKSMFGLPHNNFKLELLPVDNLIKSDNNTREVPKTLDELIDATNETTAFKKDLKVLWRDLYGERK